MTNPVRLKTFKYRIYPTRKQRKLLNQTLETCRWTYNYFLDQRKHAWEKSQKSIGLYDQTRQLKQLKLDHPELQCVFSQTLEDVCFRIERAYQAFFRRLKAGQKPGYPRFKGIGRYDSI